MREGAVKRNRFAAPSFGALEKQCFMRSAHFYNALILMTAEQLQNALIY